MNRQKKIASVFAGVSFIAMSAALSPVFAAGTTVGPAVSFPSGWSVSTQVPVNRDYIEFNDVDVTGDVILDRDIGGGSTENDIGFGLGNGSTITGNLIVSDGVYVTANETVSNPVGDAQTSLVGIFVEDGSQVGGSIDNNGTVGGYAQAQAGDNAFALAFGVATIGDEDPVINNYGDISGTAVATAYDTAWAIAGGVGQVSINSGLETATLYNEGSINASATARSINGEFDAPDVDSPAIAIALGAGQLVVADTAVAYVTNASDASISVDAYASAVDTYAETTAVAGGLGVVQAAVGYSASAFIDNHGVVDVDATAHATSVYGSADAVAVGGGFAQVALGAFNATANIANTSDVEVGAYATATSVFNSADATAIGAGALQVSGALFEDATATIANDGSIHVNVNASASSYYEEANANAYGFGTLQVALSGAGDATTVLTNTSPYSISVYGSAEAFGDTANANSYVIGAGQIALSVGAEAYASIINDGLIHAVAYAYASGSAAAYAEADSGGVKQLSVNIIDAAHASLTNSSDIIAAAHAFASASTYASAQAGATGVVQLSAGLGPVDDILTNTGNIHAYATANAYASTAATAHSNAAGVKQWGLSLQDVTMHATNSAYASIAASAYAHAGTSGITYASYADARASATGIYQGPVSIDLGSNAPTITLPVSVVGAVNGFVTNNGTVSAYADAHAFATISATATAVAIGVDQEFIDIAGAVSGTVTNTNNIYATAQAYATAFGTEANFAVANATATGVDQYGNVIVAGNATLALDNSGLIRAAATATASGSTDIYANANVKGVEQDSFALLGGDASSTTTNSGTILAFANSYATSYDEYSDADADSFAVGVEQGATAGIGAARAELTNYGTESYIGASAQAYAAATSDDAEADATATGVHQTVFTGVNYLAEAHLTNDGTIYAGAYASASTFFFAEDADADAFAIGVYQEANSLTGTTLTQAENFGSIYASATGHANASEEGTADAGAVGIGQVASTLNGNSTASVTNHGDVLVYAAGFAFSDNSNAYASGFALGVGQYAESFGNGLASATVDNTADGVIRAHAYATASGYYYASADATATGVGQFASSGLDSAIATINNDGSIWALADAYAGGDATGASASATATGVAQGVLTGPYGDDATAMLTNTASDSIHGVANATATGSDTAYAYAEARGAAQFALAGANALVETNNSGLIAAQAHAQAAADSSGGSGTAYASATGLLQSVSGVYSSTARLDNSGTISGDASAIAYGENDYAQAIAYGHLVGGDVRMTSGALLVPMLVSTPLTLDVYNTADGVISGHAFASASDSANALAAGAWYNGFDLAGTIDNDGLIRGDATVEGAYSGTAHAFGVVEVSGLNNTTLTNTGTIIALADGPNAYATGIAVASYVLPALDAPLAPVQSVTTINNDGGVIFAGVSAPDVPDTLAADAVLEEPIYRGNAINTRGFETFDHDAPFNFYGEAPNAVVINLTGGVSGSDGKAFVMSSDLVSDEVKTAFDNYSSYGYVYGNILLTKDDEINVSNGLTIFDGGINPDGLNNGDLNILDGGKLAMIQNPIEGPSASYVQNLTVNSGGTLVYELTPSDGAGDYPTIDAVNASLSGDFVALYDAGLYSNNTFYDNIIDADALTGQFANVLDNSVLLDTEAEYDGDNNVDLNVTRVAFNKVDGLTKNQKNVGGAIEKVYFNIDENTDFGHMVANMFTLGDGDYQNFLDQLSGAEYADHLQSVLWSTRAIDRIVTERMECAQDPVYQQTSSARIGDNTVTPTADAIMSTGCFRPGEGNIWMRGFGQWNNLSGDNNAPGYDETQYGLLFGADYAFNEDWFAGLAGGYFNSSGDFDKWGGRGGASIDYDGLQLAAYGGYDNSTYYLRGIVAYGNYSGDAHRMVELNGTPIDPSGDPSSDTWSFYGETGYRFALGGMGDITPFAGLSIATASLDGFTEKDKYGTGAALKIHDSDANSVASVLGARLSADMAMGSGIFRPVFSVAWMHEFDDTAQEVNMSFAGAPSGASFKAVGSEVARDSAVVDAGAKFLVSDRFDIGLFYNGQFNADYTSNAVTAEIGYKF